MFTLVSSIQLHVQATILITTLERMYHIAGMFGEELILVVWRLCSSNCACVPIPVPICMT